MMKKARHEYGNKPDSERRINQSKRIVEIITVHRMSRGKTLTVEEVRAIASKIGRSDRTVWRHLSTLKMVYENFGSYCIDG